MTQLISSELAPTLPCMSGRKTLTEMRLETSTAVTIPMLRRAARRRRGDRVDRILLRNASSSSSHSSRFGEMFRARKPMGPFTSASVNGCFYVHARPQHQIRILVRFYEDFHRNALHHFYEIPGGFWGGKHRLPRAAGAGNGVNHAFELLAVGVHVNPN